MESPRDRMDCIERWLKCSIGKRMEFYFRSGESAGYTVMKGVLKGIGRVAEKDASKPDDHLDARAVTLFIDQGEENPDYVLRFSEDANTENIGKIVDPEIGTLYLHTEAWREMLESTKPISS